MADADAQSPEIARAERCGNVFQTIAAGKAATVLDLDASRLQIEFVVRDEYFRGCNPVEPRERAHREPASVHERPRNREPRLAFSHERMEFRLRAKADGQSRCEL